MASILLASFIAGCALDDDVFNTPYTVSPNLTFDDQDAPPSIFDPIGVWEIIDSIQATRNHAPKAERWPIGPLSNGRRLVITESVFSLDEYDGFLLEGYDEIIDGDPDVMSFIAVERRDVNWNYFSLLRLLHEAEQWVINNLPHQTISVGFYLDDISLSYDLPDKEIFVVDSDTILYTDTYYFYKLTRVE